MCGTCSAYGGEQKSTQGLGGETERKIPLGGPRHGWEVNIKMDLQEVGCWSGSGQGQLVGTCECGNKPSDFIKCGEFFEQMRNCQLLKKDAVPCSQLISQL